MRICLDANILLELLFHRARYDMVIATLEGLPNAQFCISALSVDLVMYFVEIEKQSKDLAWQFMENYEILDLTSKDVAWAHTNDRGDFEDALQIACARNNRCQRFVTLDQKINNKHGQQIEVLTVR